MIKYPKRDDVKEILEHFRVITAIPRCSLNAQKMQLFIEAFAKKCGYEVYTDDAGNVVCHKGVPKLCLQAHYDMVCIGEVDPIALLQEGSLLKAKNSTLGADNGMGMALMFNAMEHFLDLECLFTADEEVGLIGASAFKTPLRSRYLLNLDSEEEGEICIGCAGGVDVVAKHFLHVKPLHEGMKLYEIRVDGFLGGHSGVDIDKDIPSAIKVLARELSHHKCELIHFEGGDRRNAIPKSAKAIIASATEIKLCDARLHVKALDACAYDYTLEDSSLIIGMLNAFAQGVRAWDKELNIPSVSINMGLVRMEEGRLLIDCAARAMDDENLAILANETEAFFTILGFEAHQESWHGAWKPDVGDFAKKVLTIMQKTYPRASLYAIHAGLECGELIAHQPRKVEALSIGPTIRFPHSLREECDLDSVVRMKTIVNTIINEVTYGID